MTRSGLEARLEKLESAARLHGNEGITSIRRQVINIDGTPRPLNFIHGDGAIFKRGPDDSDDSFIGRVFEACARRRWESGNPGIVRLIELEINDTDMSVL